MNNEALDNTAINLKYGNTNLPYNFYVIKLMNKGRFQTAFFYNHFYFTSFFYIALQTKNRTL